MMQAQARLTYTYVLVLLILIGGLFSGWASTMTPTPVTAQGEGTRTPALQDDILIYRNFYLQPETFTGNANWILAQNTFESKYPEGFKFTIQVRSSGGTVTNASVGWSHVPGQQRRHAATFDSVCACFVADWVVDVTLPPWLAVNYYWSFTDSMGNTYHTAWFMGEEYADNTRPWTRIEGDDLIIFMQQGLSELAAEISLEAMADQRETYRAAWGALLSYKPRAVLFADQATFNEWRIGFVERSDIIIIGQTSGDWGATVQVVSDGNLRDLGYGTVLHEVAHLYQAEFVRYANLAGARGWWTEGQATFFEINQQYDYEERVRFMAVNGLLEPLLQGAGPNPSGNGPDGFVRYGYDVGYTFFKWLVEEYGLEGHQQVMTLIRQGSSRNEALETVTGLTIIEIEQSWREWLGATGEAPTLIPTPTIDMRFPPTVTPFIFPTEAN